MMPVPIPLIAVSLLAATAAETTSINRAAGQYEELRCDYSRILACSVSGCQDKEVKSYLILPTTTTLLVASAGATSDDDLPEIRSCDSLGCVAIRVRAVRVGAFINLVNPKGTYVVRMAASDLEFMKIKRGEFMEMSVTYLGPYVSFGHCPAVAR